MAVDIFSIQPHKVSRDLRGYSVMFYGEAKSGKTTISTMFPKHLLLGFEIGWNAIPNAMALPMNKWTDFKAVLRQLEKPEAKEMYENIIIDTLDIAADLCAKYVASQEGVQTIADIGFGKGFQKFELEFDSSLRKLMQLGYGVIMISHSTDKTFTDENGIEYNKIVPTLDKRATKISTRMADIIGYSRSVVNPETDQEEVRLFVRGTNRFVAGSRFPDIPEVGYTFPSSIPFSYEDLVGTIHDAVEAMEKKFGSGMITDRMPTSYQETKIEAPVEDLILKFNTVAGTLMEEDAKYWGPRITDIVTENLGQGAKISEALPNQVDLVDAALTQLKEVAAVYSL